MKGCKGGEGDYKHFCFKIGYDGIETLLYAIGDENVQTKKRFILL